MSFVSSGRKSSTPSILKKPGRPKSLPAHSVKFQLPFSIKGLLLSYVNEKNQDAYVELIYKIRDAGNQLSDDELIQIITEAKECISILNEELRLFVQVILLLKWVHRSDEAVLQYKNFVLDLCSAHNYYTQFALQQFVSVFTEDQEEKCFQCVHDIIRSLLKIIPMSKEVLLNRIKRKFPFRTENARIYLNYTHNVLNICTYEPSFRREILTLIITKLTHLDTMSSREDIEKTENCINVETEANAESIFTMEVDNVSDFTENMKHEMACKLDHCLHRIFKYIYAECHDKNDTLKWEKVKSLYQDLIFVFENVILPTYGSVHIQFVMFYLISFKRKLTLDFINYLWNKVTNPNISPVIRQASVYYLCGLLVHASFVPISMVKTVLQNFAVWLHQYIDNLIDTQSEDMNIILRIHGVFYATCQALFYLINSRHSDLVNCDKDLRYLEKLNIGKIVTCSLNPLLVCSRMVVNHFARITSKYQLAYCFPLLNTRSATSDTSAADVWLDGCFPFDCYLLKNSKEIIKSIHREIKEIENKDITENNVSEIEDDFIFPGILSQSPQVPVLSSSPFFGCMSV